MLDNQAGQEFSIPVVSNKLIFLYQLDTMYLKEGRTPPMTVKCIQSETQVSVKDKQIICYSVNL